MNLKVLSTSFISAALLFGIVPNAFAGTAINSWTEGSKSKTRTVEETYTFVRDGASSFSYTRNGVVADVVEKDSFTVDGYAVAGIVDGNFFGTDFVIAGIGGDDLDVSLISSITTDDYNYNIEAESSDSFSHEGTATVIETSESNSDFKIHELTTAGPSL